MCSSSIPTPASGIRPPGSMPWRTALRRRHGLECSCLLTRAPRRTRRILTESAGQKRGDAADLCLRRGRHPQRGGQWRRRGGQCGGNVHPHGNRQRLSEKLRGGCAPAFRMRKTSGTERSGRWISSTAAAGCCLTIACSGIDARVAESVHTFGSWPLLSGRGSYLAAVAVNGLFRKIGQHWRVTLDGETEEGDFALVSVCNGRHYGGGSTPVPEARLDDGILADGAGEKREPAPLCPRSFPPTPPEITAACRRS